MNISNKIEEIRRKPEHIRMRYVWGSVLIVMLLVLILWAFSIQDAFRKKDSQNDKSGPLRNYLDKSGDELPSIQNFSGQDQGTSTENEITNPQPINQKRLVK